MKKKLISATAWFIVVVLWTGIFKYIFYKIDIYYSILAAQQFTNDSTYGKLQFHSTATKITDVIFLAGIAFIVYKIKMILLRKN